MRKIPLQIEMERADNAVYIGFSCHLRKNTGFEFWQTLNKAIILYDWMPAEK